MKTCNIHYIRAWNCLTIKKRGEVFTGRLLCVDSGCQLDWVKSSLGAQHGTPLSESVRAPPGQLTEERRHTQNVGITMVGSSELNSRGKRSKWTENCHCNPSPLSSVTQT